MSKRVGRVETRLEAKQTPGTVHRKEGYGKHREGRGTDPLTKHSRHGVYTQG